MATSHPMSPPFSTPGLPDGNGALYRKNSAYLSGPSAAMSQLLGQIRRVAPYFRTALLTGERSCGEEAAARELHMLSPLAHRSFLVLTDAAIALRFGAHGGNAGLAGEGMIYLPQPETLPRSAQDALARLLREHGGQAPRIAAFAERGLRPLVSMGSFSAELAESLGALRVVLPPLRERTADIPHLLQQMLRDQAMLQGTEPVEASAELLELAARQPWLGNFEQMHLIVMELLKRSSGERLVAKDLEAVLSAQPQQRRRDRREVRMVTLEEVVQEHLREVLCACNGNKLRAAEVLGISRSTLYRMLDAQRASELATRGEETLLQVSTVAPFRLAS